MSRICILRRQITMYLPSKFSAFFAALAAAASLYVSTPSTSSALPAGPDITGTWYVAGLEYTVYFDGGSVVRETDLFSGQAIIGNPSADAYSFIINGEADGNGDEIIPVFNTTTLYRNSDPTNLRNSDTFRTLMHQITPDLLIYKDFDITYDGVGNILEVGSSGIVFSRSPVPIPSVNLANLATGTYGISEFFHTTDDPSAFEFSTDTVELSKSVNQVVIDDGDSLITLNTTTVPAVEGYSDAYDILTSQTAEEDTFIVQLDDSTLIYFFAYVVTDFDSINYADAGIGIASAIPEPSAASALLGCGVLALVLTRRKRRVI
jgi:hypothetical protein